VIGPGKMGLPVARDLRGREFGVIGHRRSGSPELAGGGGIVAGSAADAHAAQAGHHRHRDEHHRRVG
jgi:3-hydroxyisobutyrate dehydrogenase-like beta-hydroxyacid dehydrogenase